MRGFLVLLMPQGAEGVESIVKAILKEEMWLSKPIPNSFKPNSLAATETCIMCILFSTQIEVSQRVQDYISQPPSDSSVF